MRNSRRADSEVRAPKASKQHPETGIEQRQGAEQEAKGAGIAEEISSVGAAARDRVDDPQEEARSAPEETRRAREETRTAHEETRRAREETRLAEELNSKLKREIEEGKRVQARLKAVSRDLTRSNQDLEQFSYVASHDLRAPLRGIDNLAQWITEDAADVLPAPSRKHLAQLRHRIERMERLLDGILMYSRAGRIQQDEEWVDTRTVIKDAADMATPSAGFTIKIEGEMPIIFSQRAALQQVILNLIGNAIKHHDRASGTIEVSCRECGDYFEFAVADDGPGISSEFHEKIFQMFTTLKPRDQVEASGIGLAVVKRITENHGGRVTVDPANGRGTCFRFTWPKGGGEPSDDTEKRHDPPRG